MHLYSPWNSPGQNTGVGSLSLLQRIFLIQESNWGLLHCRWILYQLSYQGPKVKYKLSLENYSHKFSCWVLLLISLFSFISFILPSFLSTICKLEYIHCHMKTTQTRAKMKLTYPLLLLLLLLLRRSSRVRLCATPEMAAHQAPSSLGFSRQERWSGLPFPSPLHESEK